MSLHGDVQNPDRTEEEIYYLVECWDYFWINKKDTTGEQLYIGQRIVKEVNTRPQYVDIWWIDTGKEHIV